MKGKYLLGALLASFLGAAIAIFAYTKIVDNHFEVTSKDSSKTEIRDAMAFRTALQMQDGQVDFTYAAEETVHAVVHVHTKTTVEMQADNPLFDLFNGYRYPSKPREVSGYGSGVIISEDGYIITNNHVIDRAETVEVTLNDKRTFTAKVIGRDPSTDIALLKIEADNLAYIRYGDSDQLKLGDWVLAVGNPFNLTSTVTAGIVSAKGRSLQLNKGDYRIESFIQTDAALNPGNSGGALVDTKGSLVGITSAIISPSGAYSGNSFAIPVSIVKKVVDDLREFGTVQRAIIGVNIRNINSDLADELDLSEVKGAYITSVLDDGAAHDAGLKEKDVIVKFDGVDVGTVAELQEQVGRRRPGDKATVTYIRNGKESTVQVVLKNIAGNTKIVSADIGNEEVFGAKLVPVEKEDMRSMDIDYGVKIVDIKSGKFRDLGMRPGYIILTVNGKKVKNPSDVIHFSDNGRVLRSIGGIQSDGTIFNYRFGN